MDKNHTQTPEEKKRLDRILDQECAVKLLRREVIVLHNIISSLEYKLGDAVVVMDILNKLKPHAAVDTNISKESHKRQLALGKKN